MGLLNAGSCGWCLRWPATVSRAVHGQVVDERHRRCALVSTRGPGDGAEFLTACRQKAGRSVGRWRPAAPSVGDGFIVPSADASALRLGSPPLLNLFGQAPLGNNFGLCLSRR